MMYLSWSSSDSGRTSAGGALVSGSLTRYDPFGNFRITPTTNPGVSDRGFTGHRQNNTGANDL